MEYSKYNIFSGIRDSENSFILNLLTGNADILSTEEAVKMQHLRNGDPVSDDLFLQEASEKGYLISPEVESRMYNARYLDFLDAREKDEIQLFFVPNYSCNFACSYCYQDEYAPVGGNITTDLVDAFFHYIGKEFANRKKYITVFGGEPLLSSPRQKEIIGYLVDKSNEAGLDLCIVTNGYNLADYLTILKKGRIREIQVTLDGTEAFHDARRMLKDGSGTFNRIVAGIDACLSNRLTVNLRMVIDKENADALPSLAKFAIDKGWTSSGLFKTQIGRNYELHHCQSAPDKLFSRVSLYESLYEQIKQHPYILEFYKPAFSVSKFLSENGMLPDPLFDSCPACKTEWAFDYTGNIYPCTATVGKSNESLGSFFPEITLKKELVNEWETRDVTSIPECKNCPVQLACGGGCGSVAKNRTGHVCSADCRPVKELLELGFSAYIQNG
ncbi:MAG: radical SAM protein [Bacteroidales bacterium]